MIPRDAAPAFRISAPFTVLSAPTHLLQPMPRKLHDGQWTRGSFKLVDDRIEYDEWAVLTPVEIPPELYLRELRDVDLASTASILDFYEHFGPLGLSSRTEDQYPIRKTKDTASLFDRIEEARQESPNGETYYRSFELIAEFRFVTGLLRDLTTAYSILQGHTDFEWSDEMIPHGSPAPWVPVREKLHQYLEETLNRMLRPFHAGIIIDLSESETDPIDAFFDPYASLPAPSKDAIDWWRLGGDDGRPDLLDVLAFQLYNDIARGANYSRCASETCGRLFALQLGRSEYGQHRTRGVKYCSKNCARAQANREYRRRKRQAGKERKT